MAERWLEGREEEGKGREESAAAAAAAAAVAGREGKRKGRKR